MQKLLIASVLKPINDTRMYEKLGLSLSKDFEVHIAGYDASIPDTKKVKFYPLFKFNRISFARILAPLRFFLLLLRIKPAVLIVSSHELLGLAVCYKLLFRKKIIYDVQENYFRNILFLKTFPWGIKHWLAYGVRLKEKVCCSFFNGFLLAEKVYAEELSFVAGNYLILENKFKAGDNEFKRAIPISYKNKEILHFVYTGTVAEEYGIIEAIALMKQLHLAHLNLKFSVLGYTQNAELVRKINSLVRDCVFVELSIRNSPVPYSEIRGLLQQADFLVLPYQINKVTAQRIPTRLYEGLAMRIPMIIQNNPIWEDLCKPHKSAMFVDFQTPDIIGLKNQIEGAKFYNQQPGEEVLWEGEENRLLKWLRGLK